MGRVPGWLPPKKALGVFATMKPTAVVIVTARRPALAEDVTGSLPARRSLQGLHAILRGIMQFNDVACAFSNSECSAAHGDTVACCNACAGIGTAE
jgi:hypothetical protein